MDLTPMVEIAGRFLPDAAQAAGLGALLLLAAALSLIGAALGGRQRLRDADLISGWAAAAAVFTVAGAATTLPFTAIHYAVLAAAAAAGIWAWRRDGRLGDPAALRMLVLGAPMIALVAAMAPTQWDELTQWLPNARYLVEHDGFPRTGLPRSPSVFPAYPHGLAFVIYMASRVAGHMVENAGALFNLILLLSFGALLMRLVAATLGDGRPGGAASVAPGWGWCALGALAVTALNPTFVTKIVFTAYADAGTAVALGFCAAFAWLALDALAGEAPADARPLAWQLGLAATALLALKQVNPVLFAALLLCALLVAWRDPRIRLRDAFVLLPRIVVLPLVVYAAWRVHVMLHLSGAEFSFKPVSDWSVHLVPDVLGRMALVASKKGGYFGIMAVAVVLALRALPRPRGPFDRLAVLAGGTFVLYNGFLLFTYIAAYSDFEALRVGSYWRYNMHLGGICLVFAAVGAALLWRRFARFAVTPRAGAIAARAAVALVLLLQVALSHNVRFDAAPGYAHARRAANDMARMLTPDQRLLLVDPRDSGQYLVIVRYIMHGSARIVGEVAQASAITPDRLRALAAERGAGLVWVRDAGAAVEAAFGIQLRPGSSYLLVREGGGWAVRRSWPHAPGQDAGERG